MDCLKTLRIDIMTEKRQPPLRVKRKLPFDCEVLDKPEVIKNPFSGESVELPPDAVAVYDTIKGAEMIGNNEHLRKGIDWFIKNEPDAYMKLLD